MTRRDTQERDPRTSRSPARLPALDAALRFAILYGLISIAFGLLGWGRRPTGTGTGGPDGGPLADVAIHLVMGALLALPARRPAMVLMGAAAGLAIDGDHFWAIMGFNMAARGSHALAFAGLAAFVFFALARLGAFGRGLPALTVGALAGAVPLAHIAGEALLGNPYVPFWAPFSYHHVAFSRLEGLGLFLIAVAVVTAGVLMERKAGPR